MDDIWHAVGALLALVVPLAVAWWLLGRRPPRRRHGSGEREKMKR